MMASWLNLAKSPLSFVLPASQRWALIVAAAAFSVELNAVVFVTIPPMDVGVALTLTCACTRLLMSVLAWAHTDVTEALVLAEAETDADPPAPQPANRGTRAIEASGASRRTPLRGDS